MSVEEIINRSLGRAQLGPQDIVEMVALGKCFQALYELLVEAMPEDYSVVNPSVELVGPDGPVGRVYLADEWLCEFRKHGLPDLTR